MRHLALVIPGVDRIGGAERQTILLAEGLARRGWRVSVVALSGTGGATASFLAEIGVAFVSLGMRKGLADPRGWIRFNRWLRLSKPDVVHAHLPHAAWMARWSRVFAPVRVQVDTLHSSSTGSLFRRLGYRLSAWLPDRVTAVSHAVAESHVAARMVSLRNLVIVPNGVDIGKARPNAALARTARNVFRKETGFDDAFLWFAAGRLDAVKDYGTLLSAMIKVPEPAQLVIAGSGPLEGQLRSLSQASGLEGRVRFLGFEQDVRRWMLAADGFVLSSRWEGLPMALLEAGACALPAVATDVPGTHEVVIAGQTGLLSAPGSAPALRDAMIELMQMPLDERRAMGNRARQHVLEHFSLAAVLDRWEALYGELLDANPEPICWKRNGTRR